MNLNGKKTYMVSLAALLGAAYGYVTGDLSAPDAVQTALTAIIGATLRHGIATK